jgi:hypothetical protein
MEETVYRNCACIQPQFSAHMARFSGNSSAPFERALTFNIETALRFYIYFVIFVITLLEVGTLPEVSSLY